MASMNELKPILAASPDVLRSYSSFEPNNLQLSLFAKYIKIRRNTEIVAAYPISNRIKP
ncbi:hypothetical protein D3C84_1033450 [compost metagenome]